MKDKDCRIKYRNTAPECSGNLNLLTVSKYLLHLRAETLIKLPPEKGSTFHGAFGHALKRISPYYYLMLRSGPNYSILDT